LDRSYARNYEQSAQDPPFTADQLVHDRWFATPLPEATDAHELYFEYQCLEAHTRPCAEQEPLESTAARATTHSPPLMSSLRIQPGPQAQLLWLAPQSRTHASGRFQAAWLAVVVE